MSRFIFDYAIKKARVFESKNKIGNLGEKILHLSLKYYYDITGDKLLEVK